MSKIVAIADVYSALCASRPHRPAMMQHEAMRKVIDISGEKKLDADLARLFAINAGLYPVGSWVVLSDGSRARVLGLGSDDLTKPVVSVMFSEKGEPIEPEVMDLVENPEVAVAEACPPQQAPDDPFAGF
ncbi:MAG: hypothetical protein ACYS8W_14475 [Planctomycetota bacterium]